MTAPKPHAKCWFLAALMAATLAAPARAGLVAYWNFDEASGTVVSDSAGSHTGNIVSTAAPNWVAGKNGNALQFAGNNNDQVQLTSNVPLGNQWTISTWFNDLMPQGAWRTLVRGADVSGVAGDHQVIIQDSSWQLGVYQNSTPGGGFRISNPNCNMQTYDDGAWHNLVAVGSAGTTKLYVDGSYVGTSDRQSGYQVANNIYTLDNISGGNQKFAQTLDDMAVWNHPLRASDIQALAAGATPDTIAAPPPSGAVSYRIHGDANFTAYVSNLDTAVSDPNDWVADPFAQSATAGTVVSGAVALPIDSAVWMHIASTRTGGNGYMAAQFKAPPGYIFAETNNQYITTNHWYDPHGTDVPPPGQASWTVSYNPWDSPTGRPYTAIQAQYVADETDSSFAPGLGTERIWGLHVVGGSAVSNVESYFSTAMTITAGTWSIFGTPVPSISEPQGLSAQIVRVNNNINTLSEAQAAFALRAGDANHNVSQVLTVPRADLGVTGGYASPVGVFAGDQHSGAADPEDYALKLAGYIYAPSADYTRSFAVTGDDEFRLTIGTTEIFWEAGGPYTVGVTFPEAGYWPIELVGRNRAGNEGFELSSAPGNLTTWNATDFQLLGTDPTFPVYQRPSAVPVADYPTGIQAQSAGAAFVPGTIPTPTGDGFVFRMVQSAADLPATIWSARHLMDTTPGGTPVGPVVTKVVDYRDPQSGSEGNFGGTPPWPLNTSADDNWFATRASGLIYFPSAGVYSFAEGSDDGFRLRVGNQVIGEYGAGRGHPGNANTMYVDIPEAGLYPIELTQWEGNGGSSVELSHGGFDANRIRSLLVSSRNANTAGFNRDFGTQVYSVEPVAALSRHSTTLQAKILTNVPALNGGTQLPVERWALERKVDPTVSFTYNGSPVEAHPGLWAVYRSAQVNGVTGARQVLTSGTFNFGDNYAYGIPFNSFGDTVNIEDNIEVRYYGYLRIPQTGLYSFHMDSDDNSWVFIDLNGDGAFEQPPSTQGAWHVYWYDVAMNEGWYPVEFRSREGGGGESSRLQWDTPASSGLVWEYMPAVLGGEPLFAFEGDLWQLVASNTSTGLYQVGDLASFEDLMTFPFQSTETLRLSVDIAGAIAIAEADFFFVPEPTTLVLLAGGLLAIARRRRARR